MKLTRQMPPFLRFGGMPVGWCPSRSPLSTWSDQYFCENAEPLMQAADHCDGESALWTGRGHGLIDRRASARIKGVAIGQWDLA
jgi:hypothetical protein